MANPSNFSSGLPNSAYTLEINVKQQQQQSFLKKEKGKEIYVKVFLKSHTPEFYLLYQSLSGWRF